MSDLVKLYNPANAASLTAEQIQGLQKLTSEEIKELAKAYPNLAFPRAYLLILDSRMPQGRQLPTLSTFQNLWNLREKNGQKQFVAYNFKSNHKPVHVQSVKARKVEVRDLSDTELMNLPGFKKSANSLPEDIQVKVTKIKKEKIEPEIFDQP